MKTLDIIASILLIIGGLNWGLLGLFDVNVVELLFHSVPLLVKAIYVLVGLSALYKAVEWQRCCNK